MSDSTRGEAVSSFALHVPGRNRLIDLLPEDERERITALMHHVHVDRGDVVFDRDHPIRHIDFPLKGVISVVVEMQKGGVTEVATVGNEGMVGLPLLLGSEISRNKAFNQVTGEALRMPADVFVEQIAQRGEFDRVLRLYAHGYLHQVAQAAACNRLHAVEQRLCKWILMCHERTGSTTLKLTQDFLAEMLGVRRASVTVVAAKLQNSGLIRYRRGVIEVVDRAGLEESACECYAAIRSEYERLLR